MCILLSFEVKMSSLKFFKITEQEVNFLEEARDTLRQIIQGNTDWRGVEARHALAALLCIIPKQAPTWEDRVTS